MAPSKQRRPPPPPTHDPALCHYCHKNKLNPKDRYFLPNGIQVCKECAARHSKSKGSE
jgi:hypothetical protein